MIRFVLLAAALSALASARTSGVEAGQWEIAVTVDTMEMPDMPAAVARMMVGKTTRVKHCISPEAAARGPQDLIRTDKSCVFDSYSMKDGQLNSAMTCRRGGSTMSTVTTGSFTAKSFTATGRTVSTGARPMRMTATSRGKFVGACR